MTENLVSHVIAVLITSGIFALLSWAALRGRPTVDPQGGTLLFRYSTAARRFAVALALCPTLFILALMLSRPIKDEWDVMALIGVVVLFPSIAGPFLWEFMRWAVIVSREGLDCRSPWRGRKFIGWRDIEEVSYGANSKWFIIRTTQGRTFHVSIWISGISEFLANCEYHLEPSLLRRAKAGYHEIGRPFPSVNDRR